MLFLKKENTEAATKSAERSSVKNVFLKISQVSQENNCVSVFLIKWPSACKFFKKKLQHKCSPVRFEKLLRTPILNKICKRLLVEVFYRKAVLKNFAIFIGRKLVIKCSVKMVFLVVDRAVQVSCKISVAGWLNELCSPVSSVLSTF